MNDQISAMDTDPTVPPRSRLVGTLMMVAGGVLLAVVIVVVANSVRLVGDSMSYAPEGREFFDVLVTGRTLQIVTLILTILLPLLALGPAGVSLLLYGRAVARQRVGALSGLGRSIAIGAVPLAVADMLAKQTFFGVPILVLGLVLMYGIRWAMPGRRHTPPSIDHLLVTSSAAALVAWVVFAVLTLGWGTQPQGYALGVQQVVFALAIAMFILTVGSWFIRPPRYAVVSMTVALGMILGATLAWSQMQGDQELAPEQVLLEVPAPTSDGWFPVVMWDNPGTDLPSIRIEAKDERLRLAMTSRDAASHPEGEVLISSSACPGPGEDLAGAPYTGSSSVKTSVIEGRAVLPKTNQRRTQALITGMTVADLTRLHELGIFWTVGDRQPCLPLDSALVRGSGEASIGISELTVRRNLTLVYLGGLRSFSQRCASELKDDERLSVDIGILRGSCKADARALINIRWSVIASGPGARKHLASLRACIQQRTGDKLPSLLKLSDTWILGIGTYIRSGGKYPVRRCTAIPTKLEEMSGVEFVADPFGWARRLAGPPESRTAAVEGTF